MCFRSFTHKNDHKKGKELAISLSQDYYAPKDATSIAIGTSNNQPNLQQYYSTLQPTKSFATMAPLQITGTQVARKDIRTATRPKLVRRKTAVDAKTILPPLEENLHPPLEFSEMPQETMLPRSKSWATSENSEKRFPLPEVTNKSSTSYLKKAATFERTPRDTSANSQRRVITNAQNQMPKKCVYRKRHKSVGLPHISNGSNPNDNQLNSNSTVLNKSKICNPTTVTEMQNVENSLQTLGEIDLRENPVYSSEIQQNSLLLKGNGCTVCLYKNWSSHTVDSINTIKFCEVDIKEIAGHLPKLNCKFPCLTNLEFHNTNISSFHQISCLCQLEHLNSLVISLDGNPVTELSLWKPYICYKMNTLKWLNGQPVTTEDIDKANRIFRGYANTEWAAQKSDDLTNAMKLQSTCNDMLGESEDETVAIVKEPLKFKNNPELQVVSKDFTENLQKKVEMEMKLHHLFMKTWPKILTDLINETLDDFENIDEHMKLCISKVLNES